MLRWSWLAIAELCCLSQAAASLPAALPRISFEIATEKGAPVSASQQWYKTLTQLGITSLQIRSGTSSDNIEIIKQGTADSPQYHVVGRLSSGSELLLPGGKFKSTETDRLNK